jgi:hypothetical protein
MRARHIRNTCDTSCEARKSRKTLIQIRRMRLAGHEARMGEKRNAYTILVGKAEGKRPLGRPRRRWEHIRMDLREIGWGGLD